MNLPPAEPEIVSGAFGAGAADVYYAQIHIPELGATLSGQILGILLQAGGHPHFAIIGRDLLRRFRMVYDGPTGAVTLSV